MLNPMSPDVNSTTCTPNPSHPSIVFTQRQAPLDLNGLILRDSLNLLLPVFTQ